MSGPYKSEPYATARRVVGPGINAILCTIPSEGDELARNLNAAYAAGRADADKRLRDVCDVAASVAEGIDKGLHSANVVKWDGLARELRATLASTEPAGAKP